MNTLRPASSLSYEPPDTREPILDMTVGDALRAAAAKWPDRPALIEGVTGRDARRRCTFSKALADAEKVAHSLSLRFQKGEHVAI